MTTRIQSKDGNKINIPPPITELLSIKRPRYALVPEDANLLGEVRVEPVNQTGRINVEPAGDDLADGTDALVGPGGPGPVEPFGEAAVVVGDGAGEVEGFFEVALDGFGAGVFLHALVAHAAVGEEYGDFAPLVPWLCSGDVGGVVVVSGGGGHFEFFGVGLFGGGGRGFHGKGLGVIE